LIKGLREIKKGLTLVDERGFKVEKKPTTSIERGSLEEILKSMSSYIDSHTRHYMTKGL
jgi:hypothetical protein